MNEERKDIDSGPTRANLITFWLVVKTWLLLRVLVWVLPAFLIIHFIINPIAGKELGALPRVIIAIVALGKVREPLFLLFGLRFLVKKE